MIGFRHAEPGPMFRDFISLEDALTTFTAHGMELVDFYDLEQRLLSVESLLTQIPIENLSFYQQKLVETVAHIRRLAAQRAGDDISTYFIGLLATSLAHIATFDEGVKYYSNRELIPYLRSLLRAAMLAEKLTASMKKPIPIDLPHQARTGLWIDEGNSMVWVEGKEVTLTTQEYNLLLYFYHHEGKLRTREQILKEGLDDSSEYIYVRSKFHNAIRRLRQKIEPNPQKPKYLLTVHGRGYKFVLPGKEYREL